MGFADETFYILDKDHNPVPASLEEWADFYRKPERIVKQELVFGIKVSTVFLGIDHSFEINPHRPILFETMIFDGIDDSYQERCATWDEALAMHSRAVEFVHRSHIDFPPRL